MNALRIENLTKTYPQFTLHEVSFTLAQGRIMGLIGKNGAGKSTTLKSILNLVSPDGGIIEILGRPCPEQELECKQKLGVVLGGIDFYLNSRLSVITDVTRRFYRQWDDAAYRRYLEEFDLDPAKRVRELSAGMRVKYLIALALSHHAELFIFDEPTNGLDVLTAKVVTDFLQELRDQGKTIIVSTHIFSLIEKLCDRVGIIINGKMTVCDTLDRVCGGVNLEDRFFEIYKETVGEAE